MGCTTAKAVSVPEDRSSGVTHKHWTTEYKKEKQLGVGASCSVWICTKKSTGVKFAMKILKHPSSSLPDTADNDHLFRNECSIMKKLKHPNIVEFVEAFDDDDERTYNLVTVLCYGGELFDRVSEGSFSERVASRLARQMLMAISFCHSKNIVHRDLKPENFVFETRGENSAMKLIDFGCALEVQDDEIIKDVAGSPYYVAPEVLQAEYKRTGRIWKAADMWSIGVIIFLLVHGYPPFNGEKQEQIFHKIKAGKYKFSRDIPLSNAVKDLITKLLVMDPLKRLTAQQALSHPWIADNTVAPDAPISHLVVGGLTAFRQAYRIKKVVANAVAQLMSDEDKKQMDELFKQFDVNGDGKLSSDEIAQLMAAMGKHKTAADAKAEAQEILAEMDQNNDGSLSPEEFKAMYGMSKLQTNEDIVKAFRMFDKDGDGHVTHAEMMKMCKNLSPDVVRQLIAEIDRNNDGKISLEEWIWAMGNLKLATAKGPAVPGAKGRIKY